MKSKFQLLEIELFTVGIFLKLRYGLCNEIKLGINVINRKLLAFCWFYYSLHDKLFLIHHFLLYHFNRSLLFLSLFSLLFLLSYLSYLLSVQLFLESFLSFCLLTNFILFSLLFWLFERLFVLKILLRQWNFQSLEIFLLMQERAFASGS